MGQKSSGKKLKTAKLSRFRMQEWVKQVKEWGKKADRNLDSAIQALKKPLKIGKKEKT
jgi:hypothetical protein